MSCTSNVLSSFPRLVRIKRCSVNAEHNIGVLSLSLSGWTSSAAPRAALPWPMHSAIVAPTAGSDLSSFRGAPCCRYRYSWLRARPRRRRRRRRRCDRGTSRVSIPLPVLRIGGSEFDGQRVAVVDHRCTRGLAWKPSSGGKCGVAQACRREPPAPLTQWLLRAARRLLLDRDFEPSFQSSPRSLRNRLPA